MKRFSPIMKKMPLSWTWIANAVALLTLLALAACPNADKKPMPSILNARPTKAYIVGHRGAAGLAPENTLAAFKKALQIGVDAIELDVQLTAEGKVVIYHDLKLKPEITRTPQGDWLEYGLNNAIKDLSLKELKSYDIGRLKPHTRYSLRYPDQQPADGERIPTLREVISLLQSQGKDKTALFIEIKTTPEKPKLSSSPEAVAVAVVDILRESRASHRAMVLSFDWRALKEIQNIAPKLPTVYLSHNSLRLNNIKLGQPGPSPWTAGIDVDDFDGSLPRAVKAAGGRYWAPNYKFLTPDMLREAHELDVRVFVWTPDSERDMLRLIQMGVDGIITNRPDTLKSLLGN